MIVVERIIEMVLRMLVLLYLNLIVPEKWKHLKFWISFEFFSIIPWLIVIIPWLSCHPLYKLFSLVFVRLILTITNCVSRLSSEYWRIWFISSILKSKQIDYKQKQRNLQMDESAVTGIESTSIVNKVDQVFYNIFIQLLSRITSPIFSNM